MVAIDAPLELPHPLTCRDSACPTCFTNETLSPDYSRRQLERRGRWRAVFPGMTGPMATSMLAPIAFRGIYLRRVLAREGIRVIETWPMAVLRALQGQVGNATASVPGSERHELLASVVEDLDDHLDSDSKSYPHQLDAIAAAYAAWSCVVDQAVSISFAGFEDEGQIWLPARMGG